MQTPRLNTRQWFWTLILIASVWAFAGWKTAAVNGKQSLMQDLQHYLFLPIDTLETPASNSAKIVQQGIEYVGGRLTSVRAENRSIEELSDQVKKLENALEVSQRTVIDLRTRLEQLNDKSHPGILPGDRLAANIKGYSSGAGANLIYIDKGRNEGVRGLPELMPVIADSCIVGRVAEAYPMTGSVRLLTDPRSPAVQAKIIRRADRSVVVDKCLVEGAGNGQLICRSVEKTEIKTQIDAGDLVELIDPEWPNQLRNFIVGVVAEKPRSGDNPYRYSIRILPAVNVNSLTAVDVLVRH